MEIDLATVLEKEENNDGCIYIYMESEDRLKCYGLSAYILTQIYPFIQLKKERLPIINDEVAVAYFDPEFCRMEFSGDNVLVGDEGVKVNINRYSKEKRDRWIYDYKYNSLNSNML